MPGEDEIVVINAESLEKEDTKQLDRELSRTHVKDLLEGREGLQNPPSRC